MLSAKGRVSRRVALATIPTLAIALAPVLLASCGQTKAAIATPVPPPSVLSTVAPTETAVPATPTESPVASPTAEEATPTATPVPQMTSTPLPTVTPVPPTEIPVPDPARLKIPAINVNAPIEQVGLTPDGAMDVPKKWEDVAWYDLGARPGAAGNAVIAGHLDSDVAPAVFWRLGDLRPGDHLYIVRTDNTQLDFVVQKYTNFPFNDASALPTIFGAASSPNLNLITCGGTFDRRNKNYSNRLVVFATLSGA